MGRRMMMTELGEHVAPVPIALPRIADGGNNYGPDRARAPWDGRQR